MPRFQFGPGINFFEMGINRPTVQRLLTTLGPQGKFRMTDDTIYFDNPNDASKMKELLMTATKKTATNYYTLEVLDTINLDANKQFRQIQKIRCDGEQDALDEFYIYMKKDGGQKAAEGEPRYIIQIVDRAGDVLIDNGGRNGTVRSEGILEGILENGREEMEARNASLDRIAIRLSSDEALTFVMEGFEDMYKVSGTDITDEIIEEVRKFESELKDVLYNWVSEHIDLMSGGTNKIFDDVVNEMTDDSVDVYFTLCGEGVGIWDGRWDHYFKNPDDIKELEEYLTEHLGQYADISGSGSINEAFMMAVDANPENKGMEASKKTAQEDLDILRDVDVEGHRLIMWDTHRQDNRGQTYIGYKFFDENGNVLFEGEDFAGSPMHADDSDDNVRALLSFLTLRPGDTDAEYFENYTKEQLDFANNKGEELSLYTMDPRDFEEEEEMEPYNFKDWIDKKGASKKSGHNYITESELEAIGNDPEAIANAKKNIVNWDELENKKMADSKLIKVRVSFDLSFDQPVDRELENYFEGAKLGSSYSGDLYITSVDTFGTYSIALNGTFTILDPYLDNWEGMSPKEHVERYVEEILRENMESVFPRKVYTIEDLQIDEIPQLNFGGASMKTAQLNSGIEGVDESDPNYTAIITFKRSGPGKFEGGEGNIGEFLYDWVMNGFSDDTEGDAVEGSGVYDLITFDKPVKVISEGSEWEFLGAILYIDTQGFVYTDTFDTAEEAQKDFERLREEIMAEEEQFAEEDGPGTDEDLEDL